MRLTALAACVLVSGVVLAQDTHWVANRTSNSLSRLQPWGQVVQTVPTTTNLRRVVQAPDGKLWVIRFIQPQFDIYDANGVLLTTVTNPTGNPYDVAFDVAGHAWVTGGTQVHEYDANGVLQAATYVLGGAAPLGISIDANGNKWIAHRVTPGILSKIDAASGAVSTFTVNAPGMLPTVAYADYRNPGPSHIWVLGDSSGTVVEFDVNGVQLNAYSSTLASIASFAQDAASGDYFIGSFGATGPIARMTQAGVVSGTITNGAPCLGLNFDSFGRLLVTTRLTAPALSEVRRYDVSSSTLEVISAVGMGTQSAVSTRRDYALIVDPTGDADADGLTNQAEILLGTSPWDPQSNGFTSLNTVGPTASGATFGISILASPTATTAVAASAALVSPGLTLPGIGGAVFLDLSSLVLDPTGSPILFTAGGVSLIQVTIPPGLMGLQAVLQGVTADASSAQFTNATGIYVYL